MDEELKLKPCMCGGSARVRICLKDGRSISKGDYFWVECKTRLSMETNCACSTKKVATREAAIAAWNTRQPNYLQMTVDYCREHNIDFAVYGSGLVYAMSCHIGGRTIQRTPIGIKGHPISTKACYEWVIKTHTETKEQ